MNVGGVGRKFECPIGLTVDAHRTCLVGVVEVISVQTQNKQTKAIVIGGNRNISRNKKGHYAHVCISRNTPANGANSLA